MNEKLEFFYKFILEQILSNHTVDDNNKYLEALALEIEAGALDAVICENNDNINNIVFMGVANFFTGNEDLRTRRTKKTVEEVLNAYKEEYLLDNLSIESTMIFDYAKKQIKEADVIEEEIEEEEIEEEEIEEEEIEEEEIEEETRRLKPPRTPPPSPKGNKKKVRETKPEEFVPNK